MRVALGDPIVERITRDPMLSEVTCAVCRRTIALGAGEEAAVSVERGLNQLIFTHPACMGSRVTTANDEPAEPSAQAIVFATTNADGSLEPYLAYETTTIFWEVPEGSPDTTDSTVSMYLRRGYALVRGPIGTHPLPQLRSWAIKADSGQITVWDDANVVAYTAPTDDVEQEWIELVERVGYCNVLTGTGLGVLGGTLTNNVDDAIADGRVVGARIALAHSRRPHP